MSNKDDVVAVVATRAAWSEIVRAIRAGALWAMPERLALWSDLAAAIERQSATGDADQERKG